MSNEEIVEMIYSNNCNDISDTADDSFKEGIILGLKHFEPLQESHDRLVEVLDKWTKGKEYSEMIRLYNELLEALQQAKELTKPRD